MRRIKALNARSCVILLVFIILLTSCAPYRVIKYNVDDIQPHRSDILTAKKLSVDYFEDIRNQFPENKMVFEKHDTRKFDGEDWCINYEFKYSHGDENYYYTMSPFVSKEITEIISAHFTKRASFGFVSVNDQEAADYYLEGKIKRYFARHKYSYSQLIAVSAAGLLGALATSGIKTPAIVEISFIELKLYRKGGELIKELNDIEERFEWAERPDQYCLSPVFLVNSKLKAVVENLADEVERAAIEYETIQDQ